MGPNLILSSSPASVTLGPHAIEEVADLAVRAAERFLSGPTAKPPGSIHDDLFATASQLEGLAAETETERLREIAEEMTMLAGAVEAAPVGDSSGPDGTMGVFEACAAIIRRASEGSGLVDPVVLMRDFFRLDTASAASGDLVNARPSLSPHIRPVLDPIVNELRRTVGAGVFLSRHPLLAAFDNPDYAFIDEDAGKWSIQTLIDTVFTALESSEGGAGLEMWLGDAPHELAREVFRALSQNPLDPWLWRKAASRLGARGVLLDLVRPIADTLWMVQWGGDRAITALLEEVRHLPVLESIAQPLTRLATPLSADPKATPHALREAFERWSDMTEVLRELSSNDKDRSMQYGRGLNISQSFLWSVIERYALGAHSVLEGRVPPLTWFATFGNLPSDAEPYEHLTLSALLEKVADDLGQGPDSARHLAFGDHRPTLDQVEALQAVLRNVDTGEWPPANLEEVRQAFSHNPAAPLSELLETLSIIAQTGADIDVAEAARTPRAGADFWTVHHPTQALLEVTTFLVTMARGLLDASPGASEDQSFAEGLHTTSRLLREVGSTLEYWKHPLSTEVRAIAVDMEVRAFSLKHKRPDPRAPDSAGPGEAIQQPWFQLQEAVHAGAYLVLNFERRDEPMEIMTLSRRYVDLLVAAQATRSQVPEADRMLYPLTKGVADRMSLVLRGDVPLGDAFPILSGLSEDVGEGTLRDFVDSLFLATQASPSFLEAIRALQTNLADTRRWRKLADSLGGSETSRSLVRFIVDGFIVAEWRSHASAEEALREIESGLRIETDPGRKTRLALMTQSLRALTAPISGAPGGRDPSIQDDLWRWHHAREVVRLLDLSFVARSSSPISSELERELRRTEALLRSSLQPHVLGALAVLQDKMNVLEWFTAIEQLPQPLLKRYGHMHLKELLRSVAADCLDPEIDLEIRRSAVGDLSRKELSFLSTTWQTAARGGLADGTWPDLRQLSRTLRGSHAALRRVISALLAMDKSGAFTEAATRPRRTARSRPSAERHLRISAQSGSS